MGIDRKVRGRTAAAAVCVAVLAGCADPVADAITAAEKFVATKDFEEAERILARTPFTTPEDKGRLTEARERVDRAKKGAYIEEVLASVEAMTDMPQGGPFFGLASMEQFFTPPLLHRYNKQVMRYNLPVEACERRKRENALLVCPRSKPYLAVHTLLDTMVARAEQHAAQGNLLVATCVRAFVTDKLQGVLDGRPDRMMVSNKLFAVTQTLRTKLKMQEEDFYTSARESAGACSPEVVFG